MAEIGWGQIIGLALGSSLAVKVLDIFYSEIRRRAEQSQTTTRIVDEHLDPLLESADELAGKLHALARMISNRHAAYLRMRHPLTAMS